ncbi:GNAT family N-acetyltransferase [Streptomyces europaeiscabiei]|uniref:GNAT family N-acetyltransferase n=1 Tax=Streptomyces europaeiscabiei TaxID=146819 RepID=UPI0029AD8F18|nr:GNAT family N-acetyltransferase [Streptomyces europaeiscabiei]MDX3584078.1 GNAT family N-acetyltransferase [Streptomyces europaeiscabiei]WUD36247.1 GNAT family N-acetyltransferase [Streptomyces europaeiscabiei]
MTTADISLRDVRDSDLPVFWRHQSDPEAQRVAAFTREYHRDRALFDSHWEKIRANSDNLTRTVVADGEVVGNAAVFGPPDERQVTYWIDRAHWGRGIATAALTALIDLAPTRPLHAYAAADNTGSLRVLQKCGFVVTGHDRGFALARDAQIDEAVLILRAV